MMIDHPPGRKKGESLPQLFINEKNQTDYENTASQGDSGPYFRLGTAV